MKDLRNLEEGMLGAQEFTGTCWPRINYSNMDLV